MKFFEMEVGKEYVIVGDSDKWIYRINEDGNVESRTEGMGWSITTTPHKYLYEFNFISKDAIDPVEELLNKCKDIREKAVERMSNGVYPKEWYDGAFSTINVLEIYIKRIFGVSK